MSLHFENMSNARLADEIDALADRKWDAMKPIFAEALSLGDPRFSEAKAFCRRRAPELVEAYDAIVERHSLACREGVRRVGPASSDFIVTLYLRSAGNRRVA